MTRQVPKYLRAAQRVRDQIADGTLKPGQAAPSGARLARETGYSALTCRKALQHLIKDGTLVPGPSPSARARARAAGPAGGAGRPRAADSRALSADLAKRRKALGLTQPQLAALTGYSVTTIGHAETGRVWQSPAFWDKADRALAAGGQLLSRYEARAAANATASEPAAAAGLPPSGTGPAAVPAYVMIVWSDGAVTNAYPPADGPPPDGA
jgi:DNA-binding transcriptional MocR family regulator